MNHSANFRPMLLKPTLPTRFFGQFLPKVACPLLFMALLALPLFAQEAGPTPEGAASSLAETAKVSSTSNLKDWLGVDIIEMIIKADIVGKACLCILLIFSISTWSIIIYKFLQVGAAVRQSNKFVNECMARSGSLEDAYRQTAAYPDSPLAQILREGYLELEIEDWYKLGYKLTDSQRVEVAKAGVERVFERTISNEIASLEGGLIFLAVATNASPFIGLFGTVWGIMGMFGDLSKIGDQGIAALGPGIATALTVTVCGLLVAIPSSITFNYFTARVQALTSRMDSFALELSNIIQKQLLKHEI
jgi:biopolymer transport protein TolQ